MTEIELTGIKRIVTDLLSREKRTLAFEILDMYFLKAKSLSDFDTLGALALKAEYRPMYLKCAEAAYTHAETSEQLYVARSNLYKAYNALNYPEKALFYIEQNLALTPDDFETQTQKAFNLALAGDRKAGEDILLDLIKKYPHKAHDMRAALSGKMLRDGNTADGILSFIDTFKPKSYLFDTVLKMKKWEGMIQPGKTIYVEGEGGIGDEIINIRFFNILESYGMKPILYSSWSIYREDTVNLFRRHGFEVITEHYSIDITQLWTSMMSLPGYLNLNEAKLWYGPYLTAKCNPKNKLPDTDKFRIGIKCSGNPYFSQDEYRKIPIEQLLIHIPENVEIYYIDKGTEYPGVNNLSNKIESWEDTLDFINQMDCIVSSCTSLVHAAGAMGKTTLVAVPIAEYYIWSSTRKDTSSPWYGDNFYVFKQTEVRSWDNPLKNINLKLQELIKSKYE